MSNMDAPVFYHVGGLTESLVGGFGFFDVGAHEVTPQARRRRPQVGESDDLPWKLPQS